ncbi:MAG: Na(+)/H(+) antiporter subunit D [Archaeoglobaceae archaeon]|nr:Na(+)/H(+) antiporter subunit D [Archaeoglobaceae archaeon]MCX8152759.1 Na(+)/H(+) antiporter subunit D [Archaeoglobaceae archaeon]MDW8013466.1 Na(+)/H(+) antiporter subunit D [Archaeoglobaceae archaeon]
MIGLLIIISSLLIPFIPFKLLRKIYFLLIPVFVFLFLISISKGFFGEIPIEWKFYFLNYELTCRIDKLSLVFAYVFTIIAVCANIYSIHIKNDLEHVTAMIYYGSTIGAVFAGDLISLYIFWKIMTISAVFLIWFRGTRAARSAGFRYLIWHVISGSCLLAGIVLHVQNTGSIEFDNFTIFMDSESFPYLLILLGFMINAAVIPFHSWLPDSYPEASITGAIYMTAFTTKCAVYALARAFPGLEILAWLGAVMAMYGVIFAMMVNDGRRLLSYHIVSQLGYMVCGIGLGTSLAINGAVSLAFGNVIYKGLLFMGMGAVIVATGRSKFTELGGLYKYMRSTFYLYMIGAFSIAGFPLFAGFVCKTMTIHASAELNLPIIFILLEGAAIGTHLCIGLKLPWNVWFSREKPVEITYTGVPRNMLVAMGLAAFLCIFFGTYPGYKILYDLLPYSVEFTPYEPPKVLNTLQFFTFVSIAFFVYREKYKGVAATILDTDWFGRILGNKIIRFSEVQLVDLARKLDKSSSLFARKVKVLFTTPEAVFKQSTSGGRSGSELLSSGIWLLIVLLLMLVYLTYLILV